MFGDATTWKSFFYLILKFPFGIASFVTLITAFSVSGALILAPLTYQITRIDFGWWRVDNKDEATVCCLLGVVLLVVSFQAPDLPLDGPKVREADATASLAAEGEAERPAEAPAAASPAAEAEAEPPAVAPTEAPAREEGTRA